MAPQQQGLPALHHQLASGAHGQQHLGGHMAKRQVGQDPGLDACAQPGASMRTVERDGKKFSIYYVNCEPIGVAAV